MGLGIPGQFRDVAPAMGRKFLIHAGAHRTGTSSFQYCLHVNRDRLLDAGVDSGYPGRDGIPTGRLALQLPSPRHGMSRQGRYTERVSRTIAACATGRERMLLSEENIPGRMLHFFFGRFFPAAEARLDALAAGLDGPVETLLYVVRDYPAFYKSAWRKRGEDMLQAPFANSVDALLNADRGWPEIVSLMQNVLKPERFIVLDYAARGSSLELLQRLVPDVEGLQHPPGRLNVSVTDRGLMALQAEYAKERKLSDAEKAEIAAAHREDTDGYGLTEFPAEAESQLSERYLRDLDQIRAMPGISFHG